MKEMLLQNTSTRQAKNILVHQGRQCLDRKLKVTLKIEKVQQKLIKTSQCL